MVITLSKPFKYEDVDLSEINLDFENATGSTLYRADKEFKRREKPTPEEFVYRTANTEYCLIVAAHITKIKVEILRELPIKDYQHLTMSVSYFLANLEEPETPILTLQNPSEE